MRSGVNIAGLLISLMLAPPAKGQFYSLPADHAFNFLTQRKLAARDSQVTQGLQPYLPLSTRSHSFVADTHVVFRYIKEDPALDFIFKRHFVTVRPRGEKFTLIVDPLLNVETGDELQKPGSYRLYTNTRGFVACGTVGDNFYFETMFSENQSTLPDYLLKTVKSTQVIPGQGRWKTFKGAGFDYAFATGLASIRLSRNTELQFGHGKHKAGHGYRSLLLSDNAFVYPFVRLSQSWLRGKVRYTNVYASLMNLRQASVRLTPNTERLFQKKSAAFQYLEVQLHPAVQLSLFQGLITMAGDDRNRQHLSWQYFQPLIFGQLAAYGFDHDKNNVTAGADLLIKISDHVQLYGQGVIDRADQRAAQGSAVQGGLKWFDLFGVKQLALQAEINEVGRKAYTTRGGPLYTHYNQGLAFTPGNCTELVLILDYRKNRLFANIRAHQQQMKGSMTETVQLLNARAGYLINPSYNLNVSIGYLGRRENFYTFNPINSNTGYVYFSLRTSIYNLYYDF